jgi:sterol-4alpha-carboxylate 3-dehydrogenase (decarboxylating)
VEFRKANLIEPRSADKSLSSSDSSWQLSAEMFASLIDQEFVIHVASPPPTLRDETLFERINYLATRLLLEACSGQSLPEQATAVSSQSLQAPSSRITHFIYTSSASVVFDGTDQRNLDEFDGPPLIELDGYTKSKAKGERTVLAFNEIHNKKQTSKSEPHPFYTCAIRPHGIFLF